MRYFAPPTTQPVRDAMTAGLLGCILTPKNGSTPPPEATWCADNGVFGKGWPGEQRWWDWLAQAGHASRERCAFAVAPDVVCDAGATLERSRPWLDRIRQLGLPAAYVGQNGSEQHPPPWDDFDVLFLGGDDPWKLGPPARALTTEAIARGKPVHMGRVNSLKRTRYAQAIGANSVDGTIIAFAPDLRFPEVLSWVRDVGEQTAIGIT